MLYRITRSCCGTVYLAMSYRAEAMLICKSKSLRWHGGFRFKILFMQGNEFN